MLKRDLSYELLARELQALDELFSREPEDWAEWAKREPSPGNVISKPTPQPAPNGGSSYVSFPPFVPNPKPGIISSITNVFKKS